jgi:hypothetical protein
MSIKYTLYMQIIEKVSNKISNMIFIGFDILIGIEKHSTAL